MSTVSPDSVAQDQIKAFVERILRLKEEAKAINGDIREIYAEAKGNGFDKTVLGKVVNYVEKRATGAAELAEAESLFDLYLTAYDGAVGTVRATHRHEAKEPQAQPVQTGAPPGTPTSNAGTEAVEAPAINSEIPSAEAEEAGEDVVTAASSPDTQSEPAEGFLTPTSAELGDRRTEASPAATVVPSNVTSIRSHNPATHFLNADGLARLHGCLKPELCGSGQPRVKLCFNCSVKHDGPTPQVEGGAA